MESTTPLLTMEALEALKRRWREQGAPIATDVRPGIDADALDAITAPLRLHLPVEARIWWEWHDGTESSVTSVGIGPELISVPLADAAARYEREQAAAQAAIGDGVPRDQTWQASWFPIVLSTDGGVMACDCSVPEGAPTPIRYVHWEKLGKDSLAPVAASLGTVVRWWIDAIDAGAWRYDAERTRWESNPALLQDPGLERTGLV